MYMFHMNMVKGFIISNRRKGGNEDIILFATEQLHVARCQACTYDIRNVAQLSKAPLVLLHHLFTV